MSELQDRLLANLDSYWQKIVDDLVKELYIAYPGSRGDTRAAVGAGNAIPVSLTSQGFRIAISMPDYYQFLDEGVSGAQFNKGISRFSYKQPFSWKNAPPISAILKFMYHRSITKPRPSNRNKFGRASWKKLFKASARKVTKEGSRSNTRAGRKRDAESIRNGIAFAIARSIWSKGLKKTNFYSNVINDKQLEVFERQLLEQYGEFILEIIRID